MAPLQAAGESVGISPATVRWLMQCPHRWGNFYADASQHAALMLLVCGFCWSHAVEADNPLHAGNVPSVTTLLVNGQQLIATDERLWQWCLFIWESSIIWWTMCSLFKLHKLPATIIFAMLTYFRWRYPLTWAPARTRWTPVDISKIMIEKYFNFLNALPMSSQSICGIKI